MNPEWLRYYIAAKLNGSVEDIDFNPDDFMARVNSDLIGKYVNIASRASNFLTKYFDGKLLPDSYHLGRTNSGILDATEIEISVASAYAQRELGKAIRLIMAYADSVNQYFDINKPWELAKANPSDKRLHEVCSECMVRFQRLTILLKPILPEVAKQAEKLLGATDLTWADLSRRPTSILQYKHLMTRVEEKQLDALFELPAQNTQAAPPSPPGRGLLIVYDEHVHDHFQYRIGVLQHIIVPEPHNADALRCKHGSSGVVARCLFLMLSTIQFYRQFQIMRVKIQDKFLVACFNRMLAAEFGVGQTAVSEQRPN